MRNNYYDDLNSRPFKQDFGKSMSKFEYLDKWTKWFYDLKKALYKQFDELRKLNTVRLEYYGIWITFHVKVKSLTLKLRTLINLV